MSKLAQEHHAINLSQGFPNYSSDEKLFDLVHHYMRKGYNQYAPLAGVEPLCISIAEKFKNTQNRTLQVDEHICVTAGATQAVFTSIQALVHAGDEVIIFEPAFDIYEPAIQLAGGTTVRIPTFYPDFKIDWNLVQSKINKKTKMIIINFPNNPTGNLITQADIEQLEKIVQQNDIYILSDEVYEHFTFDRAQHISILQSDILFEKSIATFSFGKTFHNTGWKLGYALAPKSIMDEFKKVHQFVVFSTSTPVQYALADFMQDANNYNQLPSFYQQKRDFLLDGLTASRFEFQPTEGTYFQLLDYSKISQQNDMEFAEWLTKEKGIATIPLSPFYKKDHHQKLLRLCFAKTTDILAEAANKLCKI